MMLSTIEGMFLGLLAIAAIGLPNVRGNQKAMIYGGKNGSVEEFPYLVSIQHNNSHICGGSIIKINCVLSAAHCFPMSKEALKFKVVAGITDLAATNGQRYNISRIAFHALYNNHTQENDIVVVRIVGSFILGPKVQIIELLNAYVPEGKNLTICGFGYTQRGVNKVSQILQYIIFLSISNTECADAGYVWPITDGHICTTADEGQGACNGDSGGPLVDAEQRKLVGIVSWGSGICAMGYPDVYTRVFHYISWIVANC